MNNNSNNMLNNTEYAMEASAQIEDNCHEDTWTINDKIFEYFFKFISLKNKKQICLISGVESSVWQPPKYFNS
jgi:hypothetical protein